jgi:hypothetical protein
MKKALVILLILATAGGIFAQDLKLSGKLWSGINWTKASDGRHTIGINNDDGPYPARFDLDGKFTLDNYGVTFRFRNDNFTELSNIQIHQAYLWANFLQDMVTFEFGKIDDGAWTSMGDKDWNMAGGGGARVQIKPITGLNVGFMLTLPGALGEDDASPFFNRLEYFLPETVIGAGYENDLVSFNWALKFDSAGDILTWNDDMKWLNNANPGAGVSLAAKAPPEQSSIDTALAAAFLGELGGSATTTPLLAAFVDEMFTTPGLAGVPNRLFGFASSADGASTQFGLSVKAIPNLKLIAEGLFHNFPAWDRAGFGWTNETIEYGLGKISVGAVLTQMFWGKYINYYSDAAAAGDNFMRNVDTMQPWYKFKPYVSYAINDKLTAGLEVGAGFQIHYIDYDFNLRPKISYKLGSNAEIAAYYDFELINYADMLEYNSDPRSKTAWRPDSGEDHNYRHINQVQVNLNWNF